MPTNGHGTLTSYHPWDETTVSGHRDRLMPPMRRKKSINENIPRNTPALGLVDMDFERIIITVFHVFEKI